MTHLDKDGYDAFTKEGIVFVDFWAEWCGPCRAVGSVLEQLQAKNPNIKIGKVNVDEVPELAKDFEIMSIPTIVVYNNGIRINTYVGVRQMSDYQSIIDRLQ